MNDTKLSVILYTKDCKEDFLNYKDYLDMLACSFDMEIHVVDEIPENVGEIIENTQGEYILCLDCRIWIAEDTLRTLCFFLDEHPEAGMVGVKMLDGYGCFLPESKQKFPSSWKRLLHKSGIGTPSARTTGNAEQTEKEEICDIPSAAFFLFRRDNWEKVRTTESNYKDYPFEVRLADQMQSGGFINYYVPERVLFMKEGQKIYPHKKRRMLIIGYEKEVDSIKEITTEKMPDLEFVNVWNLGENRLMDAICRQNKMKNFTDIVFSWPDIRMEQLLLFMERMPEKTILYHIYHSSNKSLISTVR